MSVAAWLLGGALCLFVLEMWGRKHPPAKPAQKTEETVFVDRFLVADSGLDLPAVSRYLDFVAHSGSSGGLIHNYVNKGLKLLALGLRGVSDLNLRIGTVEKMQSALERYADSLAAHPRQGLDPGKVRPAFLMAADIMTAMNSRRDSASQARIAGARAAALAIPQDTTLLRQRAKVQDFFIRAGEALVILKERAAAGPKRAPAAGDQRTRSKSGLVSPAVPAAGDSK